MWCVRLPCARLILGALAASLAAWPCSRASAGDWADDWLWQLDHGSATPRFEMWVGAQAIAHAWSLYSGVTAAPFGGIRQDGLRLRAVAGYGAYTYSGPRAVGQGSRVFTFRGEAPFTDLLAGYHKQLGAVTLKAFAGVALAEHRLAPDDPETAVRGSGAGAKLVLETWWTLSDRAWASLDLSWASLHASYGGRGRLGWRMRPALSAGLEAGAAGNVECDIGRLGGFLRYEWQGGEVSASGGVSNDKLLRDGRGRTPWQSSEPYVALSWLTRF
jgi:hypothetical protein